jgi:hypothetical protein
MRSGTAQGALRGKRGGGDEMGAAASGGTPFKRCTENRGRGEENGGGGGGVGTVSRPAADGAALFWAGARRGRLTHGPPLAAGEGGRREARAARGPAWKKKVWAEPEGTMTVGIYSNQF